MQNKGFCNLLIQDRQQIDIKVIQLLHNKRCGASLQLFCMFVSAVTLSIEYSDPWMLRKV
jgi:hypothetical protein